MIEAAETEQASVVFLGHKSFRMQIGSTPGPLRNELAIPARAPENQTERLHGSELVPALDPELARTPAPPLPRTRLVVLGLTAFAIGILVTSIVDRLPRTSFGRHPEAPQTRPLQALSRERTQPFPPPPSQPRSTPSAQPPRAASALGPMAASPQARAAITKPLRPAPVRAVPAPRTRRPSPALAPASPEEKPATPSPAARWVDPFAE